MAGSGQAVEADRQTVVSLRDVHKVYHMGDPIPALDGVSFELAAGSYTAVMGPSGSGKSTLLNLIGCLDTPTAGTVWVNGRDATALSDAERATLRGKEIGFVFQSFNLMPKMTAAENVALPLVFQDYPRRDRIDRAIEMLGRVDLADRADHRPAELSGGQRQRVAIARALVNDPTILLVDEPTGSLDSDTGSRIMRLFQEINDAGNTILLVTHERHIAEHADRIVNVLDGRIESIETVEHDEEEEETPAVDGEDAWT